MEISATVRNDAAAHAVTVSITRRAAALRSRRSNDSSPAYPSTLTMTTRPGGPCSDATRRPVAHETDEPSLRAFPQPPTRSSA